MNHWWTLQKKLSGEIEIDACYVNKHVRPSNNKSDRVDRRLKENQNPKKRAVFIIRERGDESAAKTRTSLVKSENEQMARKLTTANVEKNAIIFADENTAYDALHAHLVMKRVNHSEHYVGENGESTNQPESFFSRFRSMQYGQHHQMSNAYMAMYSNEAAYREDIRRISNGEIFENIVTRYAQHGVSENLCGYWAGR